MIMDYWSDKALNHHTEATTMLYAARECARVVLQEGLPAVFARHARASRALTRRPDARWDSSCSATSATRWPTSPASTSRRAWTATRARRALLDEFDIEIGTSFGPLHGRIWRIGTMGVNAREEPILATLKGLEAVLEAEKFRLPRGAGVAAAAAAWRGQP